MTRFAIVLLSSLPALTAAAAAENLIEAGEWKVTSTTAINGTACRHSQRRAASRRSRPQTSPRPSGRSRAPSIRLRGARHRDQPGKTLKWRLQCRGQLDIDATGEFNFDSPRHYTAIITSKGRMAGALISDVKTEIEGERVGDCTQ